jgi:hypothetical protein
MSSPPRSPANDSVNSGSSEEGDEQPGGDDTVTISDVLVRQARRQGPSPEPQNNRHYSSTSSPSPPPADVAPFDWEAFETRYGQALQEADAEEKEVLKEAESLSKVSPFHGADWVYSSLLISNGSISKYGHLLLPHTMMTVL